MTEEEARAAIEHNLSVFAVRGVPRRPGDTETLLCYRRSLSLEDRELYDKFVAEGNHAGVAAQQVEIVAARELPHGTSDRPMTAAAR